MVSAKYKYLSFVDFRKISTWDVKRYFSKDINYNNNYKIVKLGKVLEESQIKWVNIEDNSVYSILGVRTYGKGVYVNRVTKGSNLKMRKYQKSQSNHLFWCKVDTKNGAFGIVTKEFEDTYGSSNMSYLKINTNLINPDYLQLLFKLVRFNQYMDNKVIGVTNRKYMSKNNILQDVYIPLPDLTTQQLIIRKYYKKINEAQQCEEQANKLEESIDKFLFAELGIEEIDQTSETNSKYNFLKFTTFSAINQWGIEKISSAMPFKSNKYKEITLNSSPKLYKELYRGKSPIYSDNSSSIILNQKCNRWNDIELLHAKTVNEDWFEKVDNNLLTKENDILINSTGEGTLGRATCVIKEEHQNLIFDSHLLLLRLNTQLVNPLFYVVLFNSIYGQWQINALKGAQATKQTELGVDNVKKIVMPLPPIKIQNNIADNICSLKEKIKAKRQNALSLREKAKKDFEEAIFG